jgi:nitrite reductase/ring-hydroxylating ferredoxin subunit|tara:strand:+ start:354 stop:608 length:255 start_codon:yes stop_codon:yes gene_type:complete
MVNKSRKNNLKSKNTNTKKCKKGTKPINIKGKLFCVGKCPHSGGPILYDPNIDDLFCPWHNSRFSLKGKYKSGPASGKNLKIYK